MGRTALAAGEAAELTDSSPCHPPQVNFDDNNPFSEGFQERERRERLREQQERQRVQLLQEVWNPTPHQHTNTHACSTDTCPLCPFHLSQVERHRAQQQQRLELEQQHKQQAVLGSSAAPPLQGAPSRAPPIVGDGLSQMPFFSSELPQDFLQSPPPPQPPSGTSRPPLSAQIQGNQQGLHMGRARFPAAAPSQDHQAGGPAQRLALEPSSSSSPISTSSSPAHLLQLYSDLLPEKRSGSGRRRDGDDVSLSSHSDDITAPPTPALSDASCSTPTRGGSADQSDASFSLSVCGLAPSSELEKQLSVAQQPFKSLEVKVSR